MLYKFDKENLTYTKVSGKIGILILASVIALTAITSLITINKLNDVKYISEETKAIILNQKDEFTKEKLKEYVLQLNIKFPYIILAQAQLETANFSSPIFKENNNLFGMKVATKRPTTNKGEENGHAFYDSWRESVVDRAFYSAQYLSDIKTEDEYLEYLGKNYAEDPQYVAKIKAIISEYKKLK